VSTSPLGPSSSCRFLCRKLSNIFHKTRRIEFTLFQANGLSLATKRYKVSWHLVFSSGDRSIIVDMTRSATVRTALTTKLNEACFQDRDDFDPYIKWLSDTLQSTFSTENR
jgi:hypothetical protein